MKGDIQGPMGEYICAVKGRVDRILRGFREDGPDGPARGPDVGHVHPAE